MGLCCAARRLAAARFARARAWPVERSGNICLGNRRAVRAKSRAVCVSPWLLSVLSYAPFFLVCHFHPNWLHSNRVLSILHTQLIFDVQGHLRVASFAGRRRACFNHPVARHLLLNLLRITSKITRSYFRHLFLI